MKFKSRILKSLLIGLGVPLFIILLSAIPSLGFLFNLFELKTLDYRFRLKPVNPRDEVAIIAIDEESIKRLGRWPWPRNLHALLLDKIMEGDPKSIFFDIFFSEESTEEMDEILATAIKKTGCCYLAYSLTPDKEKECLPITPLAKAAKGSGHVVLGKEGADGVYRNIPLVVEHESGLSSSIALVLAKDYLNIRPDNTKIIPGKELILNKRRIPIDRKGEMMINFIGPSLSIEHIPYHQVLEGKISPLYFKDKLILVGATAPALYDLWTTPKGSMHGVEVWANSILTILDEAFIKRSDFGNLCLILLLGVIVGFIGFYLGLIKVILLSLFLLGSYLHYCVDLFEKQGIWIEMVRPSMCIFMTFTVTIGYRYLSEEKKKRKLRSTFQRYVSPSIVNEIMKNPDRVKLGGERRALTVLFCDIKGFTSLAESHPPEEVVALLNEFMEAMVDCIFRHDGTLDKFMGDAVMAIFGAPIYYPDHAQRAVLTALSMLEELERLTQKWKKEGRQAIAIGIGINTGEMNVGNMGSLKYTAYTAIGDNVNLGARLEQLTRQYHTSIIISESTYECVKDIVKVKPIEEVMVKGRVKPVMIYEVLGKS